MDRELPESVGSTLPDFSAGLRIAGYRLEEQVRKGGMAVVFRAVDERLDRRVALKVMSAELAADETFRQRFIRESRAAAAVDDPHLIPIYEAGQADGILFIAMRYVDGGDAQSLLQRDGPLSGERAAAIISPVASALDAAHAAGLVHRDVKSANILLDVRQGRPEHVYLADFGISRRTQSLARLTGTGQFLGTLDYAAPEQIQGEQAGGRADQYALACTAFEFLSGEPPFRHEEASAVMWAQMTEPPPTLTSRRSDLPPAVDAILAKALAKTPEDRYATCGEFADALREALGLVPYDAGMPMTRPESGSQTEAKHQAGMTSGVQVAAVQDEQHQPTQDASVPHHRNPVDDRSQQRGGGSRYQGPRNPASSESSPGLDARSGRRPAAQSPRRAQDDLSRREELTVARAAMSAAPWGAAAATATVVAVGDLGLHIIGADYNLGALGGLLAMGEMAFFIVATAGALWRSTPSRAIRWARSNPWRFAVLPATACAAIALVLSVITGGDVYHAVLSGLWHGGVVYGLIGLAAVVSRSNRYRS